MNYRHFQGHILYLYNLQKEAISLTLKPSVQILPCLIKTTKSYTLTSQNWESVFKAQIQQAIKCHFLSIAGSCFLLQLESTQYHIGWCLLHVCSVHSDFVLLFCLEVVNCPWNIQNAKFTFKFYFLSSFLVTLSVLPDFEESLVNVLEEPDNTESMACIWTLLLGCLQYKLLLVQLCC